MIKETIEASLFLTSKPIEIAKLVEITQVSSHEIKKAIAELKEKYNDESGIKLVEYQDTCQLIVNPKVLPKVKDLSPYRDLSPGLLKVLSIIAFKGPVKQSALVNTIGNRTYEYVKILERRGLISTKKYGRTKLLKVTNLFADYFGKEPEKTNLERFMNDDKIKEETNMESVIEDIKEENELNA
jgi:segregation and condensation protein B